MSLFKKIFKPKPQPEETLTQTISQTNLGAIKKITLYIVDDNLSFLTLIENHLINKAKENILKGNFVITTFSNGEDCLKALAQKQPDIVILDYFLNSDEGICKNGDEIFIEIMRLYPHQKIVMLSGQEESSIVLSLIKLGLRDYIMKDDEMFEQLHRVLLDVCNSK